MNIISKIVFQIFTIIAALILFSATAKSAPLNNTTEYNFTRVSGNSMLPTLQSGETAVVYKAYPFKKLRVGDIVIINSEKGYNVIHRIVRRYRGGLWVTQGDNNRREDREVLTKKNFGGLALVDTSMERYQKYVASIGETNEVGAQVAFASNQNQARFRK